MVERPAKGHEGGDREDLPVIEPGVAEHLDVGGRRRVGFLATFRAHTAMTFS